MTIMTGIYATGLYVHLYVITWMQKHYTRTGNLIMESTGGL
jgi:hypothetical protein